MGHEFSGIVTEISESVQTLAVGDKVAIQPIFSDGTCNACLRGSINCCRQIGFRGVNGGGGGLSGAVVVPETNAFKLPEGLGLDVGALVEPLAVGWHGVRTAGSISPTATVLVQGAGPIGCAVILALRARGVKNIVVSEMIKERAGLARKFGALRVLDPAHEDVVKSVLDLTGGVGAEFVFDCAGVPATLEAGSKVLASLGTLVNLAVWTEVAPLDSLSFLMKELTYKGCLAYTPLDFKEVISAISDGSIKPADMITKKIAIQDVVKEGLEVLMDKGNVNCKILVEL